jgi:hypothetical protein
MFVRKRRVAVAAAAPACQAAFGPPALLTITSRSLDAFLMQRRAGCPGSVVEWLCNGFLAMWIGLAMLSLSCGVALPLFSMVFQHVPPRTIFKVRLAGIAIYAPVTTRHISSHCKTPGLRFILFLLFSKQRS